MFTVVNFTPIEAIYKNGMHHSLYQLFIKIREALLNNEHGLFHSLLVEIHLRKNKEFMLLHYNFGVDYIAIRNIYKVSLQHTRLKFITAINWERGSTKHYESLSDSLEKLTQATIDKFNKERTTQ